MHLHKRSFYEMTLQRLDIPRHVAAKLNRSLYINGIYYIISLRDSDYKKITSPHSGSEP